jgi:hypothetical protein
MSLNIAIKLPAATVAAIQQAAQAGDKARALRTVRTLTDETVLSAVQELRYDLVPKGHTSTTPTATSSVKRTHHNESEIGPQYKKTKDQLNKRRPDSYQIFVKTMSGRVVTIEGFGDMYVRELRNTIRRSKECNQASNDCCSREDSWRMVERWMM